MPKSFDKFERKRKGAKGKGTKELFGKNTPRGLRIRMEKQAKTEVNKVSKPMTSSKKK